ncbi:MAG: T9SS type A sorting domain-containing protein [Bacteroidota bacterium]
MNAAGDFVIAWTGSRQGDNGVDSEVYAQRYAADGTPQGAEFQVNSSTEGFQGFPSVGIDADGDFIIAWNNYGLEGFYESDVYAQRYAANGTPQGAEFQISSFATDDRQRYPSVAVDADGDFVIALESFGQKGSGFEYGYAVYAQRYVADGTLQGAEFQVNSFTTGRQRGPSVGMNADGDFVVAWSSYAQDGNKDGIYAQRYAANGTALGTEFQVNSFTVGLQRLPSVGMDGDGDFVIAWLSGEFDGEGQDGSRYGIFAQRFAASSVANEDDTPLPTTLALDAVFPNPVRDAATLRYALPTTAAVRLTVTDVLGRTVLTRVEGVRPAGEHEARLALGDLPSGVYVVRLDANGTTVTQRVSVVC